MFGNENRQETVYYPVNMNMSDKLLNVSIDTHLHALWHEFVSIAQTKV